MSGLTQMMREAVSRSTDPRWIGGILGVLPMVDDVLYRAGRMDLDVYEAMQADAHLAAQMDVRAAPVLSKEWRLEAARPDRPEDVRAAELCAAVLGGVLTRTAVEGIHEAVFRGYSGVEVMWSRADGQWLPTHLERRPQRRLAFAREDHALRILTQAAPLEGELAPERKILVTRHRATADTPQGRALFGRCFWPWTFKVAGWRFWVTFTERYGMPWPVLEMDAGTSDEVMAKRAAQLRSMVQDAVAVFAGGKLTMHDASRSTSVDGYERLIAACNADISKAVLGQTLTAEVGAAGSYAAAKVHDGVRADLVEADLALVGETVQQLCAWVTELNVAGAQPPRIQWLEADQSPEWWAKHLQAAKTLGIRIGRDWAHQRLQIPVPADDEPVLGGETAFAAGDGDGADVRADDPAPVREEIIADVMRRWRELAAAMPAQILAAVDPADIEGSLARLVPVDGQATEWETSLATGIFRALGEGLAAVFAEGVEDGTTFAAPSFEAAERAFGARVPLTRSEWDQLAADARQRAFTVATMETAEAVAAAQRSIETAMRDGKPASAAKSLGLNPALAETVVRNAVLGAYAAGQWQAIQQTKDSRPFVQYDTAGDERVRPAHAALDGRVFAVDDPELGRIYPPNGHRCRCTVRTLSQSQVTRRGLTVESARELGAGERADAGWDQEPGRVWRANANTLPAPLRRRVWDHLVARWQGTPSAERPNFWKWLGDIGIELDKPEDASWPE